MHHRLLFVGCMADVEVRWRMLKMILVIIRATSAGGMELGGTFAFLFLLDSGGILVVFKVFLTAHIRAPGS